MTFGEKLFKLRKENKLSQETLAEKLNTTRQAISKWENNQGYPEAEKIITLSSIFGVSTDYLLKTGDEEYTANGDGYYVSKEKAESWLGYERKSARNIGIAIMLLLLIRIPFLIFSENSPMLWVVGMALATVGIGIIIAACLSDKDYDYKVLKRNALIFDNNFLTELRERYRSLRKRYIAMIIWSFGIILFGATGILIFDESTTAYNIYSIIYTFMAVFSIFNFIYSFSMMDAYELLVENEKHTNSLWFRLLNKEKK